MIADSTEEKTGSQADVPDDIGEQDTQVSHKKSNLLILEVKHNDDVLVCVCFTLRDRMTHRVE